MAVEGRASQQEAIATVAGYHGSLVFVGLEVREILHSLRRSHSFD